ncbi:TlpA family protein disulfide reductase [Tenacibaculum larymnensis]|uniref:TlpA family protein disulfide reductase n=1 Tax=Tenacibaculum larymnensis TaxID=2878201 RepID=A0A9X4ELS9_9FLAO|nr:TlpA disulfide reductase family protein [Tenacibaculum larymnensis]MDE1206331.1 TlpA family protein disulfide reductase [Tenacibaculum larymnensis]
MKKLLFGILITLIVSCNKLKHVNYTLFTGTIKNANSKSLTIKNSSNEIVREIKVSENGTFSDTIFNTNGYYKFSDGKESSSMFLKDGYDLRLNMDAKEFDESIIYTGKGSDVNNFIAQKFLIKEKTGTTPELYSLNEEAYLAKMDEQKNTLEKSLANLPPDFVEQEKANIKYEYIDHVIKYQPAHGYFTKNKDFKVSESFPNVLKGLDLNNEEHYKLFNTYKGIVGYNFSTSAKEKSEKENISFETAALQLIKESKSKIISNNLLTNLSRQVSVSNPNAEELYNGIIELSTDETLKEQLTKQFNKIQKLTKGKISPIFVDYENNTGGATSLTDLKGKYVYIDIWATWCQPCKAEIPFLKEVEKKYHDKNIEFVSISIDAEKDHDAWKQMIRDKQLTGVQLMADNNWNSKFITEYGVQGIPHFILIDPSGKIVSSYAPRPSDKKLIELFDELKI